MPSLLREPLPTPRTLPGARALARLLSLLGHFHDQTILFQRGRFIFVTCGFFMAGSFLLALGLARPLSLATSAGLTSPLTQPEVLGHLALITLLAAGAFGVHLDRVGSWIKPASGP